MQAICNDEALLVLVNQKLFLEIKLIQAGLLKRKMVENDNIFGLTTVLFNIDMKY